MKVLPLLVLAVVLEAPVTGEGGNEKFWFGDD
jgi:hypothetical protein